MDGKSIDQRDNSSLVHSPVSADAQCSPPTADDGGGKISNRITKESITKGYQKRINQGQYSENAGIRGSFGHQNTQTEAVEDEDV